MSLISNRQTHYTWVCYTQELPNSLFDVYVYLDSYGITPDDFIALFAMDVSWFF